LKRVGEKNNFMKKIHRFILIIVNLIFLHSISTAQCSGVIIEAFPLNPQTGTHNYFGVRVTLVHSYNQDITVNGYIYDEGDPNTNHPFEVIVSSGNLTAETAATFYETDPTASAAINIALVTNCINELGLDAFWQSELDSIGIKHNEALAYAFERLQQEDLSNLSENEIAELTATFVSEFYTIRYGSLYGFTQNDLKSEILNIGIAPEDHHSLDISAEVKQVIDSILFVLENLGETETPEDFESQVNNIVDNALGVLSIEEKVFLTGYKNLITKSFEFWDQNIEEWSELFDNESTATKFNDLKCDQGSLIYSDYSLDDKMVDYSKSISGNSNICYLVLSDTKSLILSKNWQRHPCATAIASADGGGLFSGLVRGCIVGALFGAGVGCLPAAIFWGGVQATTSSLGAAITCLAMQ